MSKLRVKTRAMNLMLRFIHPIIVEGKDLEVGNVKEIENKNGKAGNSVMHAITSDFKNYSLFQKKHELSEKKL